LSVEALAVPPTPSICWLISDALGRLAVPLNTMCSRKWLVPALTLVSDREPTPTYTAIEAERDRGVAPRDVHDIRDREAVAVDAQGRHRYVVSFRLSRYQAASST